MLEFIPSGPESLLSPGSSWCVWGGKASSAPTSLERPSPSFPLVCALHQITPCSRSPRRALLIASYSMLMWFLCLFFLTGPLSSSRMMETRNLCPSSCHVQTLNTGPVDGSHSQTVSDHIMPPPANVHFLILLHTLPPPTHTE